MDILVKVILSWETNIFTMWGGSIVIFTKLIIILIAITLVLVFPACSGKPSNSASQDTEPPVSTVASETASSIENNLESEAGEETADPSNSSETTISLENDPETVEEQVLYDKDGIVIKVTDFGSTLNLDSDLIVGEGVAQFFSWEQFKDEYWGILYSNFG